MNKEHYHLIGIGGIGMSGLAHLLLNRQATVTGSDIALNPVIEGLVQKGATIYKGHSADVITPHLKVVYSSDIKESNPEYQAAIAQNCILMHRSDLLAEISQGYCSLAVAGTHGKTTTSALLSTVLVEAECDPSFAVGGVLPEFQSNARVGQGNLFVFEADESDGTFVKYHPFGAIITNINNDHLNNFQNSEAVLIEAFQTFASQVQSTDHLFWCGDNLLLKGLDLPGHSYGFESTCEWQITEAKQEGFHSVFTIKQGEKIYENIELALIGQHNVLNATAVFGLALTVGASEMAIRQAFQKFKGVLRRCEIKGIFNDILFIDDYAHHPTEIQSTLKGIRQAIKDRRLVVVFQPHRYSRTQTCLGQYGTIFEVADQLIITDIYGSGETPIAQLSHANIQEEVLAASQVPCHYVPRSAISQYLSEIVQVNDIVVTLGAGDITKVAGETLTRLEY